MKDIIVMITSAAIIVTINLNLQVIWKQVTSSDESGFACGFQLFCTKEAVVDFAEAVQRWDYVHNLYYSQRQQQ